MTARQNILSQRGLFILQKIARNGNYGAFLLDHPDLMLRLISKLHHNLSIPVTAKMRLLPTGIDRTIELALSMERAGISALAVHGRTRDMKVSGFRECEAPQS